MKRVIVILLAVAVIASSGTGALLWHLTRTPPPEHP